MHPAKQCSFEEDINIPFIVRGPNVPKGHTTDIVTTHTDLAPAILELAGAPIRDDFDGLSIPLTKGGLYRAAEARHEHVTIEHWGYASNEGKVYDWYPKITLNNTYKSVRIASDSYNLLYQVWCSNERELYDLSMDPGQMVNLLRPDEAEAAPAYLMGVALDKVTTRLDALLFVLKSCKGEACVRPWREIHTSGNVENLRDSLSPRFDAFYERQTAQVRFDKCEMGYIIDSEGEQARNDTWRMEELDPNWHAWT